MISSHVFKPCLAPVLHMDGHKTWTSCPLSYPDKPEIAEPIFYTPLILASLLVVGVVSHYLTLFVARQRRRHQITTQLQQIIALERMLRLTPDEKYGA